MKAEITRTGLVEQPSTERPQSQIVSLILTHSPPQTLGLTFFCFSFPHPFALLYFYISTISSFFFSPTRSLLWLICCSKTQNSFEQLSVFIHVCFCDDLFFHFLCLHRVSSLLPCVLVSFFSLAFPPPHAGTVSSEAPLFYVSLDNGSDTLTLALM